MARLVLGAIVFILLATLVLIRAQQTGLIVEKGFSRVLDNQPNPESFGQCLTKRGIVLYVGINDASHIQQELLRESLPTIDVVDCTQNAFLCEENHVTAVPSWDLLGNRYTGIIPVGTLSDISACPY